MPRYCLAPMLVFPPETRIRPPDYEGNGRRTRAPQPASGVRAIVHAASAMSPALAVSRGSRDPAPARAPCRLEFLLSQRVPSPGSANATTPRVANVHAIVHWNPPPIEVAPRLLGPPQPPGMPRLLSFAATLRRRLP